MWKHPDEPTRFRDDKVATKVVHSVDYDYNLVCREPRKSESRFQLSLQTPDITLADNAEFIETLVQRSKHFDEAILFQGSARQNLTVELYNAGLRGNGLACEFIVALGEHFRRSLPYSVRITTDRLLAPDLAIPEFIPGYTHAEMLVYLKRRITTQRTMDYHPRSIESGSHGFYFDAIKFSFLYAQIQHVACQHPQAKIEFNFYDDSSKIIDPLLKIFRTKKGKQLIPHNLCLYLHCRPSKKKHQSRGPIFGIGPINKNYKQSYQHLCEHSPKPGIAFVAAQANHAEVSIDVSKDPKVLCNLLSPTVVPLEVPEIAATSDPLSQAREELEAIKKETLIWEQRYEQAKQKLYELENQKMKDPYALTFEDPGLLLPATPTPPSPDLPGQTSDADMACSPTPPSPPTPGVGSKRKKPTPDADAPFRTFSASGRALSRSDSGYGLRDSPSKRVKYTPISKFSQ